MIAAKTPALLLMAEYNGTLAAVPEELWRLIRHPRGFWRTIRDNAQ